MMRNKWYERILYLTWTLSFFCALFWMKLAVYPIFCRLIGLIFTIKLFFCWPRMFGYLRFLLLATHPCFLSCQRSRDCPFVAWFLDTNTHTRICIFIPHCRTIEISVDNNKSMCVSCKLRTADVRLSITHTDPHLSRRLRRSCLDPRIAYLFNSHIFRRFLCV